MAKRTSPLAGLSQASAWASSKGWGISLVIDATDQSPARRANSRASERWKGRNSRRWVLIVSIRAKICAPRTWSVNRHDGSAPAQIFCAGQAPGSALLGGALGRRLHRHEDAPVALGGELDAALGQGKQGVIIAHAHVRARVPAGAALAHQNIASKNALTAVALDPEPSARGVAAVARGAACLFVCHRKSSLLSRPSAADDILDANRGLLLPVTPLAPRVFAPALFEGDDLGGPTLLYDLRRDLGAGNAGGADLGLIATQHQHLGKLDDGAGLASHLFDNQDLIGSDAVLLAGGIDDSVHF